jgi:predicted nucleic acid-binding protein
MILVDTTPLVALCDARDALHRTAREHLSALLPTGLCVCEAILTEACFHLPHGAQRQRLAATLEELRIDSLPTGDAAFRTEVFVWLFKYANQEPDWADGCIAVLCGRDKKLRVWTYDREFRAIWRRPDGRAIPMAVR